MNKKTFTLAEKDPTKNPPLILGEGEIIGEFMSHTSSGRVKKCAFTLAETLIVLVILGVIAAITIPAVVRRQMEANNRARIKKSMTVYDTAINKFIVENDLKSDAAVYQIAPKNNCTLTSQYFKAVENIEENGNQNLCKFKSADGVWWDISDILNPIIGLKRDDLTDVNSNTSFKLSAKFDQNGSLRVDDLAYETKLNSDDLGALEKIYAFINGEKVEVCDSKCKAAKYFMTDCENPNDEYDKCTNCKSCTTNDNGPYFVYDERGNVVALKMNRLLSPGYNELYEYNDKNQKIKEMTSCSGMFGENCIEINYYKYNEKGQKISHLRKSDCANGEDKCSEYIYYYYNEQNEIENAIYKSGCADGEDKCQECRDKNYNIIECPNI